MIDELINYRHETPFVCFFPLFDLSDSCMYGYVSLRCCMLFRSIFFVCWENKVTLLVSYVCLFFKDEIRITFEEHVRSRDHPLQLHLAWSKIREIHHYR